MGYRGEGYTGAGYDRRDDGYGQGDGYETGGYVTGTYGTDGYGAGPYSTDGYARDDYDSPPGSFDSGAYHGAPHGDAYGGASYGSDPHGSGPYTAPSHDTGSYRGTSYVSEGYPTLGHPSGGYPTQPGYPNGPSEIPDPYADSNDWYGGQTGARQTGFADTSAQLALRDPVRGYPPEPARSDSGPGYAGQQRRYNESAYVAYPGYEGVEEDSPGYGGRQDCDYDDYAETRLDPIVVDYDAQDGYGNQDHYGQADDYGPGWGAPPQQGRGFGQALQGDAFDGGLYRDGYADADADMLGGPGGGTGPQRGLPAPQGPGKPTKGAPRKRATAVDGGGPRPKRRSRAVIATAAGVVLIAAAGFGGYKYLVKQKNNNAAEGTNKPLPTSAPSSATAQCVQQFGEFCHIQLRTDDPVPLTVGQLYPPAFFSEAAKADFTRVATQEDKDCSKAVLGNDLITQLKKGQCNQVLRGSYLSGDGTMMGTIGVINLSSTNQAHYAGKIIGSSNFVMPLATSKGPAAKLGQGTGVVEAEYKGHYLIITWAEFTSTKSPGTAAQTQQLEGFENALVAGTANILLSQRMINGDTPATTPSASASASASTSASASSSPSATR